MFVAAYLSSLLGFAAVLSFRSLSDLDPRTFTVFLASFLSALVVCLLVFRTPSRPLVLSLALGAALCHFAVRQPVPGPSLALGHATSSLLRLYVHSEPEGDGEGIDAIVCTLRREGAGSREVVLTREGLFSAAVEVAGLAPMSCYRFELSGGCGEARLEACTAPEDSQPPAKPVKLVFGSCISRSHWPPFNTLHMFDFIRSLISPDVVVLLGDLAYMDVWTAIKALRFSPEKVWRQTLHSPEFRALESSGPAVYVMHDDHEVRDQFQFGAEVDVDEDLATVEMYGDALHHLSRFAWLRQANEPSASSDHWHTFRRGNLVGGFVLDTRSHRSGSGELLGDRQWEALEAWLLDPKGPKWRLLFTPVMVSGLVSDPADAWPAFPKEKARLLTLARKARKLPGGVGVVILSGDAHYGAVISYDDDEIWEFSASPFQAVLGAFTPGPSSPFTGIIFPEIKEDKERGRGETVHLFREWGFFFGEVEVGLDGSLTVALYEYLVGEPKKIFEKKL
jgi:hypothetical protein